MRIKYLNKKLVGYKSLKAAALLKNFWDETKNEAVIPEGYTVETDGVLWSIRLDDQEMQG